MDSNLVSVEEIRAWIDFSSDKDNAPLLDLQSSVSNRIKTYCDRVLVTRELNEIRDGGGLPYIILKQWPVYLTDTNFEVWVDSTGKFEEATKVNPSLYRVKVETGSLELISGLSFFPKGRGNVKIRYSAGLSRFEVVAGQNDMIDIVDSGGTAAVAIPAGSYDAEGLRSTVETALNSDATLNGVFTVFYSFDTTKWVISSSENFEVKWKTGANKFKTAGKLFGFSVKNDTSNVDEIISDGNSGIPKGLRTAAKKMCQLYFHSSVYGEGIQHLKSKSIGTGGSGNATTAYVKEDIPEDIEQILNDFRRKYF